MTVALVSTSPRAIVATYPDVPNPLPLPSGDEVAGAQIGWTGEGFALVAVAAFAPPAGQVITGAPSYALDDAGTVIVSYPTGS